MLTCLERKLQRRSSGRFFYTLLCLQQPSSTMARLPTYSFFHFPPPFLLLCAPPILLLIFLLYLLINSRCANLSHIPGPLLARYTDLWNFFQAWKIVRWGGKVEFYQELQAQYGDVVRVGPRSVVVLDPAAVPIIYGVRARLDKVCRVTHTGRGGWNGGLSFRKEGC